MAASAEWTGLAAAREVTVHAIVAAAAVPALCDAIGIGGWVAVGVATAACTVAFITWVILADEYHGVSSSEGLLARFLVVFAAFWALGRLMVLVGIAALTAAWYIRLRYWPVLSPPGNLRSAEMRSLVVRYRIMGMWALVVATAELLCVLAKWAGAI